MASQLRLKLALNEDGFSGASPVMLLALLIEFVEMGILMASCDVCIPVFCLGAHPPSGHTDRGVEASQQRLPLPGLSPS